MTWCIETIQVTPWVQNCSLIHPEGGGPAVLVDPGGDWDRVGEAIERTESDVRGILLTHGHIDHIGGLPDAVEATGAPVWLHPEDLWLFDDPGMGSGDRPPIPVPSDVTHIDDGDTVEVAGLPFDVLHTPGHSPGHVCYHLADKKLLIGGDLIFAGSIGRTDLPRGDLPTLIASVVDKVWVLDDDTRILPGHGPPTTVRREKATNPFVGTQVVGDLRA